MRPKKLLRSLKDAGVGLIYVFKNEQNFRIQIIFSVLVILCVIGFGLTKSEAVVIILLICLVLALEIINSVLEKFVDLVKPRLNYQAKMVKDMMAATVFLSSIGAAIIGLIIFWPYLFELLANK
jgi:diacylglycerol kinase